MLARDPKVAAAFKKRLKRPEVRGGSGPRLDYFYRSVRRGRAAQSLSGVRVEAAPPSSIGRHSSEHCSAQALAALSVDAGVAPDLISAEAGKVSGRKRLTHALQSFRNPFQCDLTHTRQPSIGHPDGISTD